MSIKNCWHKGESYSSYCGSAEVNCESECQRAEERTNRKSFGAIAYSPKDGAFGYSDNWGSKKEAEETALGYCKEHSKTCKSLVWFKNSCGAVAVKGSKIGSGTGGTIDQARQKALKDCGGQGCVIRIAHCSG